MCNLASRLFFTPTTSKFDRMSLAARWCLCRQPGLHLPGIKKSPLSFHDLQWDHSDILSSCRPLPTQQALNSVFGLRSINQAAYGRRWQRQIACTYHYFASSHQILLLFPTSPSCLVRFWAVTFARCRWKRLKFWPDCDDMMRMFVSKCQYFNRSLNKPARGTI